MDSRYLKRLLVIIVPVLLAALFVIAGTAIVATNEEQLRHRALELVGENARAKVNAAIRQEMLLLEGLRAYWLGSQEVTKEEFEIYARTVTEDVPGLLALQWIDPQNVVRYVYPLEGENLRAVDFDNSPFPNRMAPLTLAKETRSAVATKPIMLVQGVPGTVISLPIFRGEEYLGAAVVVVSLESLLGTVGWQVGSTKNGAGFVSAEGTTVRLDGSAIFDAEGKRILDPSGNTEGHVSSPATARLYDVILMNVPLANQNWQLVIGQTRHETMGVATALSIVLGALFVLILLVTLVLFDRRSETLRQLVLRERDFVSLVSHQLRLPLTQLSWLLDSSFEGQRAKDLRGSVEDMRTIVRGSVRLVTDLLNISRVERGVLKIEREELPLTVLIDEMLLPFKETGASRKVSLDVDVPPALTAYVDRQKAIEALRNVVDNAIKYSPEGSHVRIMASDAGGGMTRIVIRDNGKGIPKDVRGIIFEKSTLYSKKGGDGAGIGLYLTKKFIELMGGTVTFETSGRGTSFFVTVPSEKDPAKERS
jgi:signal transduction histidine kinase